METLSIEKIVILVLGILVVVQYVERYFYSKQMWKQVDHALKAALSHNVHDYTVATRDPTTNIVAEVDTDEVELSQASNEEFEKYITNTTNN